MTIPIRLWRYILNLSANSGRGFHFHLTCFGTSLVLDYTITAGRSERHRIQGYVAEQESIFKYKNGQTEDRTKK